MPAQVLDRQIEFYGEQAGELWQVEHKEVMFCRDVEDVIGFGLVTLENIRRRNKTWAAEVRGGRCKFDWEDSRRFANVYKLWLRATERILEIAAQCQAQGYEMGRADELRAASRELVLTSFDVDRIQASVESLQQGRGIPHAKAMNDLRDRLRNKRS